MNKMLKNKKRNNTNSFGSDNCCNIDFSRSNDRNDSRR